MYTLGPPSLTWFLYPRAMTVHTRRFDQWKEQLEVDKQTLRRLFDGLQQEGRVLKIALIQALEEQGQILHTRPNLIYFYNKLLCLSTAFQNLDAHPITQVKKTIVHENRVFLSWMDLLRIFSQQITAPIDTNQISRQHSMWCVRRAPVQHSLLLERRKKRHQRLLHRIALQVTQSILQIAVDHVVSYCRLEKVIDFTPSKPLIVNTIIPSESVSVPIIQRPTLQCKNNLSFSRYQLLLVQGPDSSTLEQWVQQIIESTQVHRHVAFIALVESYCRIPLACQWLRRPGLQTVLDQVAYQTKLKYGRKASYWNCFEIWVNRYRSESLEQFRWSRTR